MEEDMVSTERSSTVIPWLDSSRVIAMFAIVLLHTAASSVVSLPTGSTAWWIGNIYDSLVRWSVPVFVMISGALLLNNDKSMTMLEFYKRRVNRVAIPLLFWSGVYIVFGSATSNKDYSILHGLKEIATGQPYFHLWFIYMITCLYAFTPFIKDFYDHSTSEKLWIFVALVFVISAVYSVFKYVFGENKTPFLVWFLPYTSYFIAGALIARMKQNYVYLAIAVFSAAVILTAIGIYIARIKRGDATGYYFYDYLSLTTIPMALAGFFILRVINIPSKPAKYLSGMTLGIYLIHPLVLFYLQPISFVQSRPHLAFVIIPIVSALIFIVSAAATVAFKSIPYVRRVV